MNLKKVVPVVVLSALLMAVFFGGTANAITGNYQSDSTHSCVGLVVFYGLDQSGNKVPVEVCSGVLISPTVMLTAAHACTTQTVQVCFDMGPITPTVTETGVIQLQGVTKLYEGVACPNPDFSFNLQNNNGSPNIMTHVVAVVILKEPVPTNVVSQYGQLPAEGLVDTLKSNTQVTLVGYGVQEHLSPRNTGLQQTWVGLLMRNSAQAKLVSGNFAWSDEFVRCSANPGQGRGGTAFGDSGGPVFIGGTNTVIALTSYVSNANCVGGTYHCRIDNTDILNWINQEVEVHG